MRRAFCRLSGGWRAFGGEGWCGGAALCFPPDAWGGRALSGRGGVHGGRSARKTGESRAERNSGVGGRREGDRAGKNRTWTDVRKAERPQATQGVCDRELTVCEGRNLRADGKCVWARRAESTCGVKPWIANSGRGRGVGRSGSACCPASPHSHPQISPPLPQNPSEAFPQSVGRIAGVFRRFGMRFTGKPGLPC